MPAIIFNVIQQQDVSINFSDKMMSDFPVHEHYMIEVRKFVVIYKFKPTRRTEANMDLFVKALELYFKRKYKAYSVTYGGLQEQLPKPKTP